MIDHTLLKQAVEYGKGLDQEDAAKMSNPPIRGLHCAAYWYANQLHPWAIGTGRPAWGNPIPPEVMVAQKVAADAAIEAIKEHFPEWWQACHVLRPEWYPMGQQVATKVKSSKKVKRQPNYMQGSLFEVAQ